MRKALPVITVALLAQLGTAQSPLETRSSQSTNGLISAETHAYLEDMLATWNCSGLSVTVVRKNEAAPGGWETDFGSYGVANANGDPVTPDTMFAIASNSKLFTALSMGLLISNETLAKERGSALKWTSKLAQIFNGTDLWRLQDHNMEQNVNLQDMLSHRTGMPRHDWADGPMSGGVSEMVIIIHPKSS